MINHFIFSTFLFITTQTFAQLNNDTLHIYFDFDAFTIDEEARNLLQELNYNPAQVEIVELQAHCDTIGTVSYNQKLADLRLNTVKNALLADIESAELYTYGETIAGSSRNYNAQNFRRVDIIFRKTPLIVHTSKNHETIKELESEKALSGFLEDTIIREITIQLSVNFIPGEDILLPGQEPELKRLFEFLRDNPTIKAHIRGHVCCSDDPDLSMRRAFRVYDFLIDSSISGARLSYKGYSNTLPYIWPEVTEEDRISNRRVDVIFSK